MKYDSGLQSVNKSGVIKLKPFEKGYAPTNKKHYTKCTLPGICNYQSLDGERRLFYLDPLSLKRYIGSVKT